MKKPNTDHHIIIKGARTHNLKNIDVIIPKNKFVVITGVSGSGKSSLTIDTLYAEGQRRYVESLSSYARQFLMRMNKPEVDYIKGICPAIAIEQKVISKNSRSTVGSMTEIYDYLKLFYARAGETFSPISGEKVQKDEVQDVITLIESFKEGTKFQILAPLLINEDYGLKKTLELLVQKGFTRILVNGERLKVEDVKPKDLKGNDIRILIDRIVAENSENNLNRCSDSIQLAFFEGGGSCSIDIIDGKTYSFNNKFEKDGLTFVEPTPQFFAFNSPFGACPKCEGFGTVIGVDPDLVVPDKSKSVFEGAIACWKGEKMKMYLEQIVASVVDHEFPIHRPYRELDPKDIKLLWEGNSSFEGIYAFFKMLEANAYKIQYRVMLSRYRGRTSCQNCAGSRLNPQVEYVKIDKKPITELMITPIEELVDFFDKIKLTKYQQQVSKRILFEIEKRLKVMMDVGLGYLTLNRNANTLSGGETQRINLTRTLGSNLTSSMYVLDEPSIGLHSKDTERLIGVLRNLRDLGNTVLVVEHDEEIIRAADHIIDMGPLAGELGGEVIFNGDAKAILKSKESLTGAFLTGKEEIELPEHRRKSANVIHLKGASHHNLKNIDIKIPLKALTVVSGISGSGKTTLIKKILYPALMRELEGYGEKPGSFKELSGDISQIQQVEMVDQNPLGRSSRSNPVTYIKAYDAIRDLYSKQKISKVRGYKPKHFSFNVDGGRCETCKGEGEITVEMQFLADVHLRCDECNGKRFKREVLEVKHNSKSIADLLDMTIDQALEFFENQPDIFRKIKPLQDVGLGYIRLGQSSNTLSGGEAQRVKLASFLGKESKSKHILFIFDEPSTGLHFADIRKLMTAIYQLIENGHSVIIIEHNIDIIKCADWLIDLGPEGGKRGGELVFQGLPEKLVKVKKSATARYLAEKL